METLMHGSEVEARSGDIPVDYTCQQFLNLMVEGDERYTKVKKNVPPEDAQGWTSVLLERASRFIWELHCGRKDRTLFKRAIRTRVNVINTTADLALITDGERR